MPNPTTSIPVLRLPDGGSLQGFPLLANRSAACSATASLLSQAAPLLALLHCQTSVLKLLKPLIDVVRGLPNPTPSAIQEFTKAALDIQPCLAALVPATQVPLARDLICLEIRGLNCFLDHLNTAQRNPAALNDVLSSYSSIVGVLSLAGGVFQMAGLTVPQAPALSGNTDHASILADGKAVRDFVSALQSVADSIGGC